MSRLRHSALLITLVTFQAHSGQLNWNFSSSTDWTQEENQLYINLVNGRVLPPYQVSNWNDGSNGSTPFHVGDGRHGAFNEARMSVFGTVVGNTVTIDTDTYSVLQFTTFELPSHITLTAVGSRPLTIRVQGATQIDGIIMCSGNAGTGTTSSSGRCGGGAGGAAGVAAGANGAQGSSGGTNVTGGQGGDGSAVAAGEGGAGGGGYSSVTGNAGGPGGGGAPQAGTSFQNDAFTVLGVGSGGGGGGAGSGSSGGAGGAGGGGVYIYSAGHVSIGASAEIRADGGAGANVVAGGANAGGAGGGGAGGSILIFSAGDISVAGANGPPYRITANQGAAGTGPARNGGIGGSGRIWMVDSSGATEGSPSGASAEEPSSALANLGRVVSILSPVSITSRVIDLQNSFVTPTGITAVTNLPNASSVSFEMRGSTDNFVSSDSGWKDSSQLNSLKGYRYYQFRITLDNDNATSPAYVDSLQLIYDGFIDRDFDMVGAGCGQVSNTTSSQWPIAFLFLFLFGVWFRLRFFSLNVRQ